MRNKKARLRSQCDVAWFKLILAKEPLCLVCKNPAVQVHHFFPKNLYPQLRYDLANGVSLCLRCHFLHHHRGDPSISATIIAHKGMEWYEHLKRLSKKEFISKWTLDYYKQILKELECS